MTLNKQTWESCHALSFQKESQKHPARWTMSSCFKDRWRSSKSSKLIFFFLKCVRVTERANKSQKILQDAGRIPKSGDGIHWMGKDRLKMSPKSTKRSMKLGRILKESLQIHKKSLRSHTIPPPKDPSGSLKHRQSPPIAGHIQKNPFKSTPPPPSRQTNKQTSKQTGK